ncbi:MAG TPA: sensor histidine kinase [Phenylobacterium sp.]
MQVLAGGLGAGTTMRAAPPNFDKTRRGRRIGSASGPGEAQAALPATSGELLAARDDERQRIAIELHDSTSQHLAAMSLALARLRHASRHDEAENAIIDEISALLNEVSKETRVLSYLMKPRSLGQNGLSASVLEFLEGFGRRTGLRVTLEAHESLNDLPAPLQYAAMRIVQEALLNANRHARARCVAVELAVKDGSLTVAVADDGCGMRSDRSAPSFGVGIPGMQARAQQFSGDVTISSDASGTRVEAKLPLTD